MRHEAPVPLPCCVLPLPPSLALAVLICVDASVMVRPLWSYCCSFIYKKFVKERIKRNRKNLHGLKMQCVSRPIHPGDDVVRLMSGCGGCGGGLVDLKLEMR